MGEFSMETARDGNVLFLRPTGDLDLVAAYEVDRAVEGVDGREVKHLVIDLRGLTFIDSTGLHTLTRAAERARRQDWQMALVRAPEKMERVFEMTGTYEAMNVVDSAEEALALFKSRA